MEFWAFYLLTKYLSELFCLKSEVGNTTELFLTVYIS